MPPLCNPASCPVCACMVNCGSIDALRTTVTPKADGIAARVAAIRARVHALHTLSAVSDLDHILALAANLTGIHERYAAHLHSLDEHSRALAAATAITPAIVDAAHAVYACTAEHNLAACSVERYFHSDPDRIFDAIGIDVASDLFYRWCITDRAAFFEAPDPDPAPTKRDALVRAHLSWWAAVRDLVATPAFSIAHCDTLRLLVEYTRLAFRVATAIEDREPLRPVVS